MDLLRGFDFSAWQGTVDWNQVPADRAFGYLRVFEWRDATVDTHVQRNVLHASATGRTVGGYLRVDPTRWSPERETARFYGLLATFGLLSPGRLIPAVDIEPTGTPGDKVVNWPQWTGAFFDQWRLLTGLPLVVYSSGSYFNTLLGGTAGWPPWVKCWVGHSEKYSRPKGLPAEQWAGGTWYEPDRAVVHQYTTTGRVSGISTAVDLDCLMPGVQLADITLHAA